MSSHHHCLSHLPMSRLPVSRQRQAGTSLVFPSRRFFRNRPKSGAIFGVWTSPLPNHIASRFIGWQNLAWLESRDILPGPSMRYGRGIASYPCRRSAKIQ